MNRRHITCLLLPMIVALSACGSTGIITEIVSSIPESTPLIVTPTPTDTQTLTSTLLPSPTSVSPTVTFTQTPTLTPFPTMESEQAEETMSILLKEPVDCPAPCFWGIVPGQTTLNEARNIFTHLGLEVASTTYKGKDFYGIRHDFNSGISIIVTLTVQNDIVINLRVDVTPEKSQPGVPREWLAYSPETLIDRYGTPSRVDFIASRSPADDLGPYPWYVMTVYFESADLVIEYGGGQISSVGSFRVCPLSDQFNSILIWLGKNPENPPGGGITLGKATSLTLEEFASIMKGDLEDACIELESEAFYE